MRMGRKERKRETIEIELMIDLEDRVASAGTPREQIDPSRRNVRVSKHLPPWIQGTKHGMR